MALALCMSWVGACAPAPSPTPTLGPVPRVAVTSWHAPRLLEWAEAYRDEFGPLPFDLEVVHAGVALDGVQRGTYALAIGSLVPPKDWFATPLGEEAIGVLAGSGAGVHELTQGELASLLAGRSTNWSAFGGSDRSVLPIIPLPGDDVRAVMEQVLMRGAGFASASRLAASPEQGLKLLEADAGGLLLVPIAALPSTAALLRIDGAGPGGAGSAADDGYPLFAARVAVALKEPSGAIRDWLVWVQGEQLAIGN